MEITAKQIIMGKYDGDAALIMKIPRAFQSRIESFLSKKSNKPMFTVKIEPKNKKRSLDSNKYMWVLCEKIAVEIKGRKEEVYKQAVREVGQFVFIDTDPDKTSYIANAWSSNGIGWFADLIGEKMVDGKIVLTLQAYMGSSTYTQPMMTRLIDYLVEEAQELGIETLTPEELERLHYLTYKEAV